ncbi:MAG: BlaI/MecI/CopY family transcriptional regulator [Lachnospiraceae bacterium]|nr:BlaI/MecI/CopY family transcriptional regulator [Lachnospiraceae bacterium]
MAKTMSKTEYEIMEHFWNTGEEFSFSELMVYFNEEEHREWKKQTLNTFLMRLIQKGILTFRKEGKKSIYRYKLSKAEYETRCAEDILDENYGGKLKNFIAALSGSDKLTEQEKDKLFAYIEEK